LEVCRHGLAWGLFCDFAAGRGVAVAPELRLFLQFADRALVRVWHAGRADVIVKNTLGKGVNHCGEVEGFFANRALKGLIAFSDVFAAMRPAPDRIQGMFCFFLKKAGGGHAWFAYPVFTV